MNGIEIIFTSEELQTMIDDWKTIKPPNSELIINMEQQLLKTKFKELLDD